MLLLKDLPLFVEVIPAKKYYPVYLNLTNKFPLFCLNEKDLISKSLKYPLSSGDWK